MEIIWSTKATTSLDKIRLGIRERFSLKEEIIFIQQVVDIIKAINEFPKGFPESKSLGNSRKAVIHPHSTLFYRIESKHRVRLLLFWDNRNDPRKIK